MKIRQNEVYTDLEMVEPIKSRRKGTRVSKMYGEYLKLSTIERENFLNLIQNKGRF